MFSRVHGASGDVFLEGKPIYLENTKTIALHSYREAIELIKVITKIEQKPNFRNFFLNFIIPITS